MELYEILDKAADVMTERGHVKNNMQNAMGQVCLAGAVTIAMSDDNIHHRGLWSTDEWHSVMQFLDMRRPERSAISWNNLPETTESEVIEFLREAAIAAKEQRDS